MVVGEANINNIMGGLESTGGVRLHNHKRKLKQRFDIIKKLGQGTYGKVQLGINKETGQEVAIKTIKKCKIETEADLIRIRREIQIMSSVQHPNIIHIYEVFENREKMVLVMEYAAGGELYDYLSERKVLTEEEARRIFRQIATAVFYCHKHKICHRDLKLENILLDENGNAKIADFGLSNVFDESRLLSTFCGSPLYASPEIVKGTPYHGPEVDCWSLGVLLYTLVYGAMPFDGSNFKRLVKQISQGDYFEPKKPSPASPLIRLMLTVSSSRRADMEKICSHWWVNEGYEESCLDIAEELANQTPVRLDLLLSLAPPPPQVGSDKLLVASEEGAAGVGEINAVLPTRSMSVGSILERNSTPVSPQKQDSSTKELKTCIDDLTSPTSPKRKLEVTVSTENANQSNIGAKRKERSRKKDRDSSSERRSHRSSSRNKLEKVPTPVPTVSENEPIEVKENEDNTKIEATMDVVEQNNTTAPTEEVEDGAMCAELVEEANKKAACTIKEKRKSVKIKKPKSETVRNKIVEEPECELNVKPVVDENVNKENESVKDSKTIVCENDVKKSDDQSAPKTVHKKKILGDKNDGAISREVKAEKEPEVAQANNQPIPPADAKVEPVQEEKPTETKTETKPEEVAQPPAKPIERRRSKIFETAEKFQNMLAMNETNKPAQPEKPKKIFIPGVNVGGFKQAFERKASLTNPATVTSPVKNSLVKKSMSVDGNQKPDEQNGTNDTNGKIVSPSTESPTTEVSNNPPHQPPQTTNNAESHSEDQINREKLRNAVNIISNAIDREGARKSKSRPTMIRKPPVPFGASGRSASGGITHLISPPPTSVSMLPNGNIKRILQPQISSPNEIVSPKLPEDGQEDTQTSSLDVNLKSATLPRRKTSKAEITLNYPQPKPPTMKFKTEMQHRIDEHRPQLKTQRSEVAFPVSNAPIMGFRSTSLEPDNREKPMERIIPISFEDSNQVRPQHVRPVAPVAPRPIPQRTQSQRSNSVSRQSTQDSDTDSTVSGSQEPIRKSPREFIIPIAVEGGGYITPRAGSLEPSESNTSSKFSSVPLFARPRRFNSILNDHDGSEDESPFASLHRHSSINRDSDNEDSRRGDSFHFNRLRSSRPTRKTPLEHADSLSSGEEDDDDGFELLTAENLFSTLLSRVRSLTQRLNVEDGGRPGFPQSRLFSNFGRDHNFWDLHNRDPFRNSFGRSLSREKETMSESNQSSQTNKSNSAENTAIPPWRRSASRTLSTDSSHTLPRDKTPQNDESDDQLNFSNLDLAKLKLNDRDAIALSYLTPGLSRRIQRQLLSQLPPSQARKLSRTLSMQSDSRANYRKGKYSSKTAEIDPNDNKIPEVDVETSQNKLNEPSVRDVRTDYLKRRSFSYDPNTIRNNSDSYSEVNNNLRYERTSPSVDTSDLSTRSEPLEYSRSLNMHNSDLTESDRRLLENYRKSREQRRALRASSSLFDSSTVTTTPSLDRFNSITNDRSVLSKYLSPTSYGFNSSLSERTRSPTQPEDSFLKTRTLERRFGPQSQRKVSRFLRPDFYDTPPDESTFVKEKNEREMETQKVLKEIRDKRLKRRIGIRQQQQEQKEKEQQNTDPKPVVSISETPNEKNPPETNNIDVAATKSKIAKLIRPKSYPEKRESPQKKTVEDENNSNNNSKDPSPTSEKLDKKKPEKIKSKKDPSPSKLSNSNKSIASEEKNEEKSPNKNKFLQSLEKKFEKLRAFSATSESSSNSDDTEKLSRVNSAIRRLREQSLPRNSDPITESGLIKRAISVEDLSTNSIESTKVSRKSVSKILGLFKKNEDNGAKRESKKLSSKENEKKEKKIIRKSSKVDSEDIKKSKIPSVKSTKKELTPPEKDKSNKVSRISPENKKETQKVEESQSLEKTNLEENESDQKVKSKLPVNVFRRSLDLGRSKLDVKPMRKSLDTIINGDTPTSNGTSLGQDNPKRKSLMLDMSNLSKLEINSIVNQVPADNSEVISNGNNLLTPSPSVELPSPDFLYDDSSICSDTHTLNSLLSPSVEDDNESVIDRIRRKSFYSRFNEKKKPRKSNLVGPGADYNYRSASVGKSYKTLDNKINLEPLSPLKFSTGRSSKSLETNRNYKKLTDTDLSNNMPSNSNLCDSFGTMLNASNNVMNCAGDIPQPSGGLTKGNSHNNVESSASGLYIENDNNNYEPNDMDVSINNNKIVST